MEIVIWNSIVFGFLSLSFVFLLSKRWFDFFFLVFPLLLLISFLGNVSDSFHALLTFGGLFGIFSILFYYLLLPAVLLYYFAKSRMQKVDMVEKLNLNKKNRYLLIVLHLFLIVYTVFLCFSPIFLNYVIGFNLFSILGYLVYLILLGIVFFLLYKYKFWQVLKKNNNYGKLFFLGGLLFVTMVLVPVVKLNFYETYARVPQRQYSMMPEVQVYYDFFRRNEGKGMTYDSVMNTLVTIRKNEIALAAPYFLLFPLLYFADKKKKKVMKE